VQHTYSTVGHVPPKRSKSRVRRAAGNLGDPYVLHMMGGPMRPVHMVAGRMWIDPAARPRKVTVIVEHREGEGDSIRAEHVFAVKRKSGLRVYVDAQLDFGGVPGSSPPSTSGYFLWTGGPLDPRDRDITWAWGWKSKSAKALQVVEALR
jgi:hypothetical protein